MKTAEVLFEELSSLAGRIREGELTCVEVTLRALEQVERLDPEFNAFLTLNPLAEEQARSLDREGHQGRVLFGVPVAVKDLLLTRDMPTSAGSTVQPAQFKQRRDAAVVKRLKGAGAVIIGKTNLHEFAFGVTNENEHFGPSRNPWDPTRISGGSSGGSAVAVAAGMVSAAIGTDTRGSIRIPAACCGVSGLKPTRALLSTGGVIPLSQTLDHVGPLARSVDALTVLMSVLAPDGKTGRYHCMPNGLPQGLRLGICSYYFNNLSNDVHRAVDDAVRQLQGMGAILQEVKLGSLEDVLWASDIISRAEAVAFHHDWLQEVPDRYGPNVRKRLMTGYEVTGRELVNAQRIRREAIRNFNRVLSGVDCLAAPALPVAAPPLGTTLLSNGKESEPIVQGFVRLNAPQNMACVPALAIPCGWSQDHLPIGLQLVAARHREDLLLQVGKAFQAETSFHQLIPSLAGSSTA